MALVECDGFDMYNGNATNTGLQTKWNNVGQTIVNTTTPAGRFGGQCLQMFSNAGNTQAWQRGFKAGNLAAGLAIGCAVKIQNIVGQQFNIFQLMSGTSAQLGLVAAAGTGQIQLYRSPTSGPTLLASGPAGVIQANTWAYWEIEAIIHPTAGAANVYVDGVLQCSVSGVNTTFTGTASCDGFYSSANQTGVLCSLDDWYLANTNTRLGPIRIDTLRPTSDSSVQWTPNSGVNNFSRVNETDVDGDTTYVSSGTVGNSDLYANGSLPITPTSILGVQVVTFARNTDANPRSIYQQVKSGATLSQGTAVPIIGSGYARYDRLLLTDPNTSAAWTPTSVNGVLSGPYLQA